MSAAVCHLHSIGVAHLDIKLENYMLGSDLSSVKLVDLGLWHDLTAGLVTHSAYRGSPAYMAPEVAAPRSAAPT